jgi:2-succinyl-6-hydroxy-2,4-cyclohexadiene-1-carboxylate synthase
VPKTLVLLHGFGGTRRAWDRVLELVDRERYLPIALDLPGHGDAAATEAPITFDSNVAHVLDQAPERFTLCGYSLGGRIALHVALAAPGRVERLVLVSTSAGIEDPQQRAARREADRELARRLREEPYERFVDSWRAQPLFAGEPTAATELARRDQLRNRPEALAAVMEGVGAGAMAPLWRRLEELRIPVTVVAGSRDQKYVALGRRLAGAVARGELVIVDGGHGLVHENPLAVAAAC